MDEAVKWLRLGSDLFNSRKIKQIETLPDGDGIIVIWFKLLCVASEINDCGCVYFTPNIPYTDQTLATQFNRPIPLIQLALSTFVGFDMVEIVDNFLYVTNWDNYICENDDAEAERRRYNREAQRRSREKRKLLGNNNLQNLCVNDVSMTVNDVSMTGQIEKEGVGFSPDRKESNKEKNKPPFPTEKEPLAHFAENARDGLENTQSAQDETQQQKSRNAKVENPRTEQTFPDFWQAYPRKKDRAAARKAWDKLNPDDDLIEKIIAALEKAKESREWTKEGGSYIPHPATWINHRRWEDEDDYEEEERRSRGKCLS